MAEDIIVSTTQDHLEIEAITQDLVILKSGGAAVVLSVSAINFGLLSEEEQDATIYAYAGLLNSLSFAIQILVRSEKKDISGYLELLSEQESKLKDPTLKERMRNYRTFIEETIVEQNVLDKKFYVIIPYQPVTLRTTTGTATEEFIKRALTDLEPKRDHLIKQFARLGLVSQQLNNKTLLRIFHKFYNSESRGQKYAPASDYEQPMVAPNIQKTTSKKAPKAPAAPPANTPKIQAPAQ